MERKEIVTKEENIYIANDETIFYNQEACEIYEKYSPLTLYDILKEYCEIEEEDIEDYKNNEIPKNSYLIVNSNMSKDKYRYCNIIEKIHCGISCFKKENTCPTLYYNDYDWCYGYKGWKRIGTEEEIKEKVTFWEKALQMFDKIEEDF